MNYGKQSGKYEEYDCTRTLSRAINHCNQTPLIINSHLAQHRGFAGYLNPRNEVRPIKSKDT